MSDKQVSYATDRKYAQSHEWVKQEGGLASVGISDYAQDQLGDIVFVELPVVGTVLEAGKAFGVVESVKAASDLFSPVSGEVHAVNEQLFESPETVNKDPFGSGWMIQVTLSNPGELDSLLDAVSYEKKVTAGEKP